MAGVTPTGSGLTCSSFLGLEIARLPPPLEEQKSAQAVEKEGKVLVSSRKERLKEEAQGVRERGETEGVGGLAGVGLGVTTQGSTGMLICQ